MDLIERTSALEIVRRTSGDYAAAFSEIARLPATDVAPVVHGRWTPADQHCPVCGESKFKGLDADIWADWMPPYCPNCGAIMDGGEDDGQTD
jgi:ribosomal protein L37AE/L43A